MRFFSFDGINNFLAFSFTCIFYKLCLSVVTFSQSFRAFLRFLNYHKIKDCGSIISAVRDTTSHFHDTELKRNIVLHLLESFRVRCRSLSKSYRVRYSTPPPPVPQY